MTISLIIAAFTAYGQCSISISKVTTSGCYSVSGVSKATVSVEVAWSNAPSGQYIVVTTGAQSETIIPGTRTVTYSQPPGVGSLTGQQTIVSPQVVAFEVNANSATASITARFSTSTSCSATGSYTAPAPCPPTSCTGMNLGGIVFKDFDDNGQKAAGETAGISAVTVKGIACDGTVYTTTTDNYGRYSLAVPANKYPVRVEFSNVPGVYNLGVNGSDSRTTVQFVTAPDCNVDLGVFNPIDYCSNNPVVFIPCYVNGDPLAGGNAGTATALVTIPYGATATIPTSVEKEIATASQVGSIWGLAYNKYTKRLFQSAVVKRHAGLGPAGLGGIYVTNYTNTSSPTTTTFVNVSTLGINVGTIAANSGSGNRGMSADKATPNRDVPAFAQTGKIGIGDLEISEDGDKLWLINLSDKKLYSIDISQYNTDGVTKPTAANVASFSIPASCSGGAYRPWALKVYNGKVYVGGVCDAQSSANKSNLRASVYELNGSTFTQIFDFPLTYPKGYPANANRNITGWFPWTDDFDDLIDGGSILRYPVPMFTDIEFDIDGSMVLAFADRTGFQGGDLNYRPDNSNTTLYEVNSQAGDILRAYYSNGAFVLENDAKAGPSMGYGPGNSQGPGFGEFYNDNWIQDGSGSTPFYHAENVMGGLALKPGSGEVVVTTVDPVDRHPFAGGVRYLNNTTGVSRAAYPVYVTRGIDGNIDPGTFAKATGLGDAEIACNTIDLLQIGNRVWQDDDKDGEQDACEKGLSHVIVSLYRNGTLVATTTTDDNGEYYFPNYANPSSVTFAGSTTALVANTAYQLVFGTSGQYSNATSLLTVSNGKYVLTTANATGGNKNDSNDSDAQVATVGGITAPVISLTTSDVGISNHTFDVGFYCLPTQYGSVSVTAATCSGNVASSNARISLSGIVNADKVFLVTAGNSIPSYTATGSQPVSASAVSFTGLANPTSSSGTSYSLVLYNGPCCYTITTALLPRTDCSCALSLSLTQPVCNPVNNQYTLNGTVSLSNTPATSFTVSDGIRSTVVSVTIGQTSAAFSLTGLVSGTNTHTVTVTSSGTSCGTASRTYTAPGSCTVPASVTVASTSICYGSSATLVASGCNGTVTWSNGTTGTSLVVQSLTATTSYTATCATVSQTATAVGTVTVYNRPVVTIQASSTLVTVNTPVSLTASGCSGTLGWSMGGNSTVMSVTPSQATNTYSVTCTTGPGCFTTTSITIQTAPPATVQVSSATVCAGSPASLTASGCTGSLQWSGNGANSTSTVLTVSTSSTITTQQVLSYTVTCTGLTSSTFAVGRVTVVPIPVMSVIPPSQTIVQGQPASLTATGCSNGVLVWSTGAADNGKTVITVMPMSIGSTVYSVTCTVNPGCVGSASAVVSVVPTTTLTANSAIVCAGSVASLTAVGCANPVQWSGQGGVQNGNVYTIATSSTITTQQVLSFTVSCTNLGVTTSTTATVTIVPIPSLSLQASSTLVTVNTPVSLSAVGCAGGTVTWSTTATGSSISVTPTQSTNVYSATCTVSPGCTKVASITVNTAPPATVQVSSATVCAGSPASLTASGCAGSLQWSGNGANSTSTVLTVSTSSTITTQQVLSYTVTCTEQTSSTFAVGRVTVVPIPSVTLTASALTVVTGQSVTLTANGCTGSLSGAISGTTTSAVVMPGVGSNVYSVTCTVQPGCSKSASVTVTGVTPTTLTVMNTTVCAGSPASLTALGCSGTVSWTGPNITSGANSSIVTVSTSLTITSQQVVSYTATCSSFGSTPVIATVTIVPIPVVTLIPPSQTIVQGQLASLTATGCANGALTWSTGAADNNKSVITVQPMNTGSTVYSVTCTVSPGCAGSASAIVSVVPATTLSVNNAIVCAGATASLTAVGCVNPVQWQGQGGTANGNILTVSTSSTITTQQVLNYTVLCTNLSVTTSVTASVTVVPQPSVSLTSVRSSNGTSATLVATGCAGGNLIWSTGENGSSIVVTPGATSLYSVTCTVPPGCSATARIRIGFVPTNLDVVLSGANICAGESVTITASNCDADIRWSNGATSASIIVNPSITTVYSVTCSDDVNTATASTTIGVSPTPTLALTASSPTLTVGQSATITASGCQSGTVVWSTGASGVMSIVVSPTANATYSATCTTGPQCSTTASVSVLINLLPKLELSKVVSKSRAKLGEIVSYTVTLVNAGNAPAVNVVVRDSVSGTLAIIPGSETTSVGSYTAGTPTSLWGIASLPVGATATLSFSASLVEEGIVYNTATIPGDTNTVCTTVPLKYCKGEPIQVEVTAPAGYSSYQWFRNGVLIANASGQSYTATEEGEYSVEVNQGACPSGSCCPVIIELDSVPAFTVMAQTPSCIGGQPQNNGRLTVMGLGQNPGDYRYAIAEGSSFTLVNPTTLPVPPDGVLASNLIGDRSYTVRIYNALGCFRDETIDIVTNCVCPPEVCVPAVIKKTKTRVPVR